MKITRLKKGYRIACSDAEFATLRMLVQQGVEECSNLGADSLREDYPLLETCPKFDSGRSALTIDEDRRAAQ